MSAGILITSYNQAEVYIPSVNKTFTLPSIPLPPRVWHTQTGNVICGGIFPETSNNCLELAENGHGWQPYSKPFKTPRAAHSAWQSPSGDIVLMGGYFGPKSTENVTAVDSSNGFPLNSSTRYTSQKKIKPKLPGIFLTLVKMCGKYIP